MFRPLSTPGLLSSNGILTTVGVQDCCGPKLRLLVARRGRAARPTTELDPELTNKIAGQSIKMRFRCRVHHFGLRRSSYRDERLNRIVIPSQRKRATACRGILVFSPKHRESAVPATVNRCLSPFSVRLCVLCVSVVGFPKDLTAAESFRERLTISICFLLLLPCQLLVEAVKLVQRKISYYDLSLALAIFNLNLGSQRLRQL